MRGFRLLCWNMHRKLGNWAQVEALAPDVVCLQECVRPAVLQRERPDLLERYDLFDDGEGDKGLVVGARKGLGARLHAPIDRGLKYAIAVFVAGLDLRLLGAHSYNHRALKVGGSSTTPTLDMMAAHGAWLAGGRGIVAGDLNNAPSFSGEPKERRNRFENVLRAMDEAGLASVWHTQTGEAYGAESVKTLHSRNPPHHIDYVFATASLRAGARLEIGAKAVWRERSDHLPLILEVA